MEVCKAVFESTYMKKYHDYLESNCFYHVYNRAIGSETLFQEEKNYLFFIEKWQKYLLLYLNIWAYCLMPNHFHFLVKIKNEEDIPAQDLKGFENLSGLLSKKFSDFFNSYAKSYNKIYDRQGSLFQKPFKRIKVDSE